MVAIRRAVRVTGVVRGLDSARTSTRWPANWTSPGVTWALHGVFIEVQGDGVDEFLVRLPADAPVGDRRTSPSPMSNRRRSGFRIVESADVSDGDFPIPPDAVCNDCLRELQDPDDPSVSATRSSVHRAGPFDGDQGRGPGMPTSAVRGGETIQSGGRFYPGSSPRGRRVI